MKVIVYSQPNCYPCEGTKRRLTKKGIEFSEVDLTAPGAEDLLAGFKQRGLASTPIVVVTDDSGMEKQVWSGFNPTKIDALVH